MGFRFLYIILFLFITAKLICQDIIVKKDSTKIISKLLEVNPKEIKYNRIDIPSGPINVISKNDVAYVIYSNGIKESFYSKPKLANNKTYLSKKDSLVKTLRVKDYIKFNVQLGIIVNNNYSNAPRQKAEYYMTSSTSYSSHNGNKYNSSINIGFNFIFGRSPKINHVMGINYLRSYGEYEYEQYSIGYSEHMIYNSKIDFLNFTSGLRFAIFKKIKIDALCSLNFGIFNDVKKTGYVNSWDRNTGYIYHQDIYKGERENPSHILQAISLNPKISYEFNIKQELFGVYIGYNLSPEQRLPWYMAGITYYPFKKLK
jgi:hypothetical protein